jgi:Tfp pilus assembly protein PilX
MTRLRAFRPPTHQAGSAYLAALLAMVVLSIIGLSLAFVTQTEMIIGANQRTVTRVFYDADAGINEATARVLFTRDRRPKTLEVSDPTAPAGLGLGSSIELSQYLPINDSPCNLCQINQGGPQYLKVNHAITSTATRVGNLGTDDEIPLGRKTLSVMVDIQPLELLPLDLAFDRTDADSNGIADVLETLKF